MSSIIGGPVTPLADIRRQKTQEEQEELFNGQVPEGFRVICLFVPSRAFRIIVSDDDRIFQIQQLDHAHGYKWRNLQRHKGDFQWESWGPSWNAAEKMQKKFLLELRKKKVEHRRMVRNQELYGVMK